MKKGIFALCMAGLLLLPVHVSGATFTFAGIYSSHDVWDSACFTSLDQYIMIASAQISSSSLYVYVNGIPSTSSPVLLNRMTGWDDIFPYTSGIGFGSPSPGSQWETSYTFFIDEDGSGTLNTGDTTSPWSLNTSSIQQIAVPTSVSTTSGIHPTISWSSVAGAGAYRVRFYPIHAISGNPDTSDCLFTTGNLTTTSYTYTGDLFQDLGAIAVSVETLDPNWWTADGSNRSRYITKHDPVPIPAAGWLMISGFAGLLVMRRRKRSP